MQTLLPSGRPRPSPLPGGEGTTLTGTVERVTFYNPENGFSVVKLRGWGRRAPVTVVGTLPAVQPGETLALTGRWQTDPRHGAQFRPESAEVGRPADIDGIIRYLGSGLIRQIGPVLAERIVATFGDRTLEVLDADPGRVRLVPGIGRQRADAISAAWSEHRALRAVVAFLSEHRLDTRLGPRLVGAYGADAPRILSANPYRLVAEVPGLGFAAADRLGRAAGVRETAPARLQAAMHAALLRAAEQGHTRMGRTALRAGIEALGLGVADQQLEPLAEAAIAQLLANGTILTGAGGWEPAVGVGPASLADSGSRLTTSDASAAQAVANRVGRLRIYEPTAHPSSPPADPTTPAASPQPAAPDLGLASLVRAEEEMAVRLLALARRAGPEPGRVEAWLTADDEARALSDEQRRAVLSAATSGCFVLTGGPGVGKTTATRALVRCLRGLGRSVALAAPTGKAAKRLGEVVGAEAKTLHRLLGAGPHGFRHGPREPLPFDVLIVDEASMLDTQLARAVARAVGRGGQLILVGDADQLPSVGPGQVLRDILASGRVPAARLERVFRQAARSRIVTNAHRIRHGLAPQLAPPAALAEGIDCVFVPASGERVARVAAEWTALNLPRALGVTPGEVQAVAPLTRVCQSLNGLLQARLNPPRGQAERPHGALALRVGDRVIQTRNNYQLGVFNGDGGILAEIGAEALTVDFGDGRRVDYAPSDQLDLDHAYCLTVHRSQGSEWPGVVVLASSSYGPMLTRNLLYTALTRARRAVVIVGDEAAITRAVAETRDQERSTGLAALLAIDERRPATDDGQLWSEVHRSSLKDDGAWR